MRSKRTRYWPSVVLFASLAACSGGGSQEAVASAKIEALVTAPPDGSGHCIEETLRNRANGRTVTVIAELGSPGDQTSVIMNDAPAGDVELTGRVTATFSRGTCTGATTWVADPISFALAPGESRTQRQHLRARADLAVTPDYETIHVASDTCAHTPVASPPASAEHAMAYDSQRGVIVLVSSADGTTAGSAVVYEFDTARTAWARVETTGPAPTARATAGFAFDRRTGLFVLFGGSGRLGFGSAARRLGVWRLRVA